MDGIVICYGVMINLFTFVLYGADKWKAKNNRRRISEKVLLGMAAVGGSVGAFAGMRCFRHKTKKAKFYLGVPVLFILQVVLGIVILTWL